MHLRYLRARRHQVEQQKSQKTHLGGPSGGGGPGSHLCPSLTPGNSWTCGSLSLSLGFLICCMNKVLSSEAPGSAHPRRGGIIFNFPLRPPSFVSCLPPPSEGQAQPVLSLLAKARGAPYPLERGQIREETPSFQSRVTGVRKLLEGLHLRRAQ